MKKIYSIIFLLMFIASVVNAADRYSVGNGNWNSTLTWSATSGGAPGASLPVAGDNVFIEGGRTVTITATAACASITIGTATSGTLQFVKNASNSLTVSGNISIASGSTFTVENTGSGGTNTLSIGGNLANNGTFDMVPSSGKVCNVTFNGTALQTISGSSITLFYGLTINNTGAGITFTKDASVAAVLTLTDGVVNTAATPSGLITLGSAGTISGGSAASNINGPIAKTISGAFTFPTGNGTLYRPIEISALSGPLTFTVSYFQANPQTTFGNTMGTGINHISVCEYWIIDRTEVSGSATVNLNFGTPSCNANTYVDDPASLRVARWDGSQWSDAGNTSSSSTQVTSSSVSTFSPFTVGSSGLLNPLPVKLSNIRAFEKLQGIQIDWTAYQEENLSRYAVERSANGISYTTIGEVVSLNSAVETNYGFFDASPLSGVNFYRLRSIDFDSRSGYSSIVKVNLDKGVKDISLYPNPATGGFISFQGADLAKGNYTVKVYNSTGMQVMGLNFTHTGGAVNQTLKLPAGTKSGMYSLQLVNDDVKVMSKTFMVQ